MNRNVHNIETRPAFFLDRDGVITTEKGYVTSLNELEIFPFAEKCIEEIHAAGFKAIIISNQSAVGRGYMTEDELQRINRYLINKTGVEAIYCCPHWYNPNEKASRLNFKCNCRKPHTGLIEKAVIEHGILLDKSYFVGDRESDILTGKHAGIKTVFVKTGYDIRLCNEKPDYVFNNLEEALIHLL